MNSVRAVIVGSCLAGGAILFGCAGGVSNEVLKIVILLLLFAIGVPWNFLAFIVLFSTGIAIAVPLPVACYGGNRTLSDVNFANAVLLSLAIGAFINGYMLTRWLARKLHDHRLAHDVERSHQ